MSDQVAGKGERQVKVTRRLVRGDVVWGFDCPEGFAPYHLGNNAKEDSVLGLNDYLRGERRFSFEPIADCPEVIEQPAEHVGSAGMTDEQWVRQRVPTLYTQTGLQIWEDRGAYTAYMKGELTNPEEASGYLGYKFSAAARKLGRSARDTKQKLEWLLDDLVNAAEIESEGAVTRMREVLHRYDDGERSYRERLMRALASNSAPTHKLESAKSEYSADCQVTDKVSQEGPTVDDVQRVGPCTDSITQHAACEDQLIAALSEIAALRADQESGHAALREMYDGLLKKEREATAEVAQERDEARAELERQLEKNTWRSVDMPPEDNQVVEVHGYNYDDPERGLWMTPKYALYTCGEYHTKDHDLDEDRWSEYVYVARFWRPRSSPPDSTKHQEYEGAACRPINIA